MSTPRRNRMAELAATDQLLDRLGRRQPIGDLAELPDPAMLALLDLVAEVDAARPPAPPAELLALTHLTGGIEPGRAETGHAEPGHAEPGHGAAEGGWAPPPELVAERVPPPDRLRRRLGSWQWPQILGAAASTVLVAVLASLAASSGQPEPPPGAVITQQDAAMRRVSFLLSQARVAVDRGDDERAVALVQEATRLLPALNEQELKQVAGDVVELANQLQVDVPMVPTNSPSGEVPMPVEATTSPGIPALPLPPGVTPSGPIITSPSGEVSPTPTTSGQSISPSTSGSGSVSPSSDLSSSGPLTGTSTSPAGDPTESPQGTSQAAESSASASDPQMGGPTGSEAPIGTGEAATATTGSTLGMTIALP